MPVVSIIIPSKNEQEYIEGCLESIKNQTFKDYEIIVVDSGSDDTAKIAKKYTKRVYQEKKAGPAAARNKGARLAKGSIFVFSDADCRFKEDFLQTVCDRFQKPIGGGICRLSAYDYEKRSNAILYEMINTVAKTLISMRFIITSGSCFVYTRDAFFRAGGFDERLLTNEDHDLARKVGKMSKFDVFDDIVVETSARRLKRWGFLKTTRIYVKSALLYFMAGKTLKEYWE